MLALFIAMFMSLEVSCWSLNTKGSPRAAQGKRKGLPCGEGETAYRRVSGGSKQLETPSSSYIFGKRIRDRGPSLATTGKWCLKEQSVRCRRQERD